MKTAIVYVSKHGTTEKTANYLQSKAKEAMIAISLKENPKPDLSQFDVILLGTSIYAGTPLKKMQKFCEDNKDILREKTIGLFICCMEPNEEKRAEQLKNAYPGYLHSRAKAEAVLGGEFLFDQMNFFERFIIKRISKITNSVSKIDFQAADQFLRNF